MSAEQEIWDRIIEANRLPNITNFSMRIDLNETMTIRETGVPTLEQTLDILDLIYHLDFDTALVLPEGFLYKLNARTVLKNTRRITLRRINTKKEAIEQEITPEKLVKERIEKMRARYQIKPETLLEDYAAINYLGVRDKLIKNYLICDAIEGDLHAKNAGNLIQIKRYDTLEQLLKTKEGKKLTIGTKAAIRREVLKIGSRKKTLSEIPDRARKIILTRYAIRVVKKVPSKDKKGLFYKNIRFKRIPEKFPDNKYPELNKEFYAMWTNFYTEPSCNCGKKTYFIDYIRAGQIWNCIHEIAAFRKAIRIDWEKGRPVTYPNPYIAISPFLKINKKYIIFYNKCKNQVFTKKGNHYDHLGVVYLDVWPLKQVVRKKIDLI